jgi:hypothetical protein
MDKKEEEQFNNYFSKISRYKKRCMEIQNKLIKERNIDINNLTEFHKIINEAERLAREEEKQ